MDDGTNEFLDYIALQGDSALITKEDLLKKVNATGADLSPRQLTTLISEGLVPHSTRIGSEAGVFPRIVVELVIAITRARNAGVSIEALRELIPVWKCLMRARRDRRLDLGELESIVRSGIRTMEAAYSVASVVQYWMPLLLLGNDSSATRLEIIDKARNRLTHTSRTPVSLGFVVAEQEGDKVWHRYSMRVLLPVQDERDQPTTIIAGIPEGVEPPLCPLGRRTGSAGWQVDRPHLGPNTSSSLDDPPETRSV